MGVWTSMLPAMTPARRSTASTGMVQDWPDGFAGQLPPCPWLVVHAYPRQEKKLIADLRELRVPGLMFFERRVRHYPGKGRQQSLVPLIGGYVFASADERRKPDIYQTKRVVSIIDVRRPDELARDLASLCTLVENATEPLVVRPEMAAGRRVTVRGGTFAGCQGVVVRRQNQFELVVNLELLGSSVSVTLPEEMAEAAEA
jgi:transcriptional antiterminator RfaH